MSFFSAITAKIGMDTAAFEAGSRRVGSLTKRMSDGFNGALGGRLAAAFGAAAIGAAIARTVEYASRMTDLAERLGVTTQALQEFEYAAKQNGATVDDFAAFIEKVGVSRAEALAGNEAAIESFRRLGVSIDDLKNKRADEITKIIGDAVKNGDIQKLVPALRDVGGKSATALVAAFNAGLDEAAQAARAKGLIISDEVLAELDEAGDRFDELKSRVTAGLAPVVNGVLFAIKALSTLAEAFYSVVFTILENMKPSKLWAAVTSGESPTAALGALFADTFDQVKDAWGQTWSDAGEQEVAAQQSREERRRAKREAAKAPQEGGGKKDEKTAKESAPASDSLAKIGGFIGGVDTSALALARRTAVATEAIAKHTAVMSKKKPGTENSVIE